MVSSSSPAAVDVTTCDREPIQIPGAVQPHGALVAVEESGWRIVQVSENAGALLGQEAATLLHEPLDVLLGADGVSLIRERLAGPPSDVNPIPVRIATGEAARPFDAIVHRSDGLLVLELEPAELATPDAVERFFSTVRGALTRIEEASNVASVCDVLAFEFATITGFDRTMIYKFDRDWHGEVVAEVLTDPSLAPFLGLHYPASDIPRQARELYRRNALRLIPDARYAPARIVPALNPATQRPLDLSGSVLRSVSPVHLEYLANMGVVASMSASLLVHGQLWGLVSLHHGSSRALPYRVRVACEVLARTASLRIAAAEDSSEYAYRMRLRALQPALVQAVARDGTFAGAVAGDELLTLAGASGAVIKGEGEPVLVGVTPRLREVRAILAWLAERTGGDAEEPFVTDALGLMNPAFEPLKSVASGLLAVPLAVAHGGWLLWFRPEAVRTVTWGGDPLKALPDDRGVISPRRSFDAWKTTVALHARPWDDAQIEAAVELRRLLSDVMMRRAREYARLNAELARSNEELESFAHIASHDLKEPLRGMANLSRFLSEDYGDRVDERGRDMLATMQTLAKRMEAQIESLLALARVSEDTPSGRRIALDTVLDEALDLLRPRIEQEHARIVRAGPLPVAIVGRARAREIFVNLIGNALKYNESGAPVIEIGTSDERAPGGAPASEEDGERAFVTVYVKDNGIGIRERHLTTVFRMFKRLHAPGTFGGGTGAGLAIVRKIVEQQGGAIWATSKPGEGATFSFTVPVPAA